MTNGVMTKTKGLFTPGLCECNDVIHAKNKEGSKYPSELQVLSVKNAKSFNITGSQTLNLVFNCLQDIVLG